MIKGLIPGLGVTLLLSTPALSQSQNCAPRDIVVQRLIDAYGETRQSMGLTANNAVIEMFASDTSGSWTMTVTSANGMTCLVASGQAFESMINTLPKSGNDV